VSRRRGDDFAAYVAARRTYLRRVAYLVCNDWDTAEDLVQTALAKLYVAWPRIHGEGTEDAYVRRIIVRSHVDELRRPWRRETTGLEGYDVAAPTGLPLEDSDALLTALKRLPERQRATVVLRFWCGLSVDETAKDLGCAPGTVKSNTSRAMASLRTALSLGEEEVNEAANGRQWR
jgi:RNA polymerase sigma-70 factor (sigma-E family)